MAIEIPGLLRIDLTTLAPKKQKPRTVVGFFSRSFFSLYSLINNGLQYLSCCRKSQQLALQSFKWQSTAVTSHVLCQKQVCQVASMLQSFTLRFSRQKHIFSQRFGLPFSPESPVIHMGNPWDFIIFASRRPPEFPIVHLLQLALRCPGCAAWAGSRRNSLG